MLQGGVIYRRHMIFREYIELLDDKNWKQFTVFVKNWFHDKYILTNKKFVEWQYITPFSKITSSNILVVRIKEKIMGYLGTIPLSFNYFGENIYGVCLANWQTDEALHSKGFGYEMLDVALESSQIVYITAYKPILEKLFEKTNWQIHSDKQEQMLVRRFVKIFDAEKVKKMIGEEDIIFDEVKNPFMSNEFEFLQIDSFNKDADSFWENVKNKYKITVNRNSKYLNWRYKDHPVFDYKLFVAKKGDVIKAFVVVRLEKAGEYTIGHIVDFAAEDNAEEFMLNVVCKWLLEQKADLADFSFTGDFHESTLESTGFKETNEEPYASIPYLFSPIDHKRRSTNFAFKIIDENLKNLGIATYNNFYITRGDCDQDRPNSR